MKNISKISDKLNNKGFVLAETIIVGVFVIGLITFLFLAILPLIGEYEKREKYDTLNSKYDIHLVRKMILRDTNIENILSIGDDGYVVYKDLDVFCEMFEQENYCRMLLGENYLDIDNVILSTYKTTKLKNALNTDSILYNDRATKEYIEFIPEFIAVPGRYDNYFRIIIKYNDLSFANIEVIYENA